MYLCENYTKMIRHKRLKYLSLSFLLLVFFAQEGKAQDYESSIGGRLGTYISLSYTNYLSEGKSLEFLGGITREANQSDYILGAYYRIHKPVSSTVPSLNWFFGLGILLNLQDEGDDDISATPAGIIGMEYSLEHAPVNFFVDLSPYADLRDNIDDTIKLHANLGVRYIMKR